MSERITPAADNKTSVDAILSPTRKYTLGEIDALKKAWIESVAHSTGVVSLYLKGVDQGLTEIDAFLGRPVGPMSRSGLGTESQLRPTPDRDKPE